MPSYIPRVASQLKEIFYSKGFEIECVKHGHLVATKDSDRFEWRIIDNVYIWFYAEDDRLTFNDLDLELCSELSVKVFHRSGHYIDPNAFIEEISLRLAS